MAPGPNSTARALLLLLWATAAVLGSAVALAALWPGRHDPVFSRGSPSPGQGARCTPQDPCLALVIDDVGRDLELLRALLALDADLTFAVLPHARFTSQSLTAIQARGREILVHLPMRPRRMEHITDEPVVAGTDGSVALAVRECLSRVPGAVGVNNHMGSALSEDRQALVPLLLQVRQRNLWFLDSKTSGRSVICEVARRVDVPCLSRDVFLDDRPGPAAIESSVRLAEQRARARGVAVAIGHATPETVRAVTQFFYRPEIRVVRLSKAYAGQWPLTGKPSGT